MFWVFPMKMKWAMLVLGLMALFLTIQPGQDRIAHSAHLFGAVAGYVHIKLWHKRKQQHKNGKMQKFSPLKHKKKQPAIRVPDEL